ncbi:hypothetical protein ABPG73_022393 [Tetrahymena malaccensis]
MEKIKETLDTFKQFIYNYFKESQQNTKQQIEQTLNLLAEYISEIEEQDYDQFGYYRYFIAFQSLKYLDMNQKEKECFEQIIEQFQQYVLQKIEKIKSELSEIRSKLPNDSASVSECLNRLLYEIQLIKDEDVKNQYLQGVFEITKDKIKAIFEKIIQLCKENNYHDENVKKQIQSNLEQLEYDIENIKEEKCQYGYYRYLIAFFRYKYISKDNKYSDEKKNYLKFILQNIQELENKLNELTSQQPVNEKQIEQHLENIQNEIKYIEKEDYIVFCYYKYLIASNKIKYNLNPNQKENYEKQLNDYKNLYEKCKYQRQQNNNQDENLNSSNNILSTITKGCRNISRNMSEQEKQRHQRIQQSFSNIDSTEIKQQSQMFNRQSQDSIDGNDFSFSKVFENRSDRQSQQLISNLKIKQPIQEDKIMESFSINSNNSLDSFCSLQLSKNDQEQINQNQNKKNNQLINQIQKPESIVQSKNLQNDQDKAVKLIQQLTQPQKEMLDQNKREKSFILKEEINQKSKILTIERVEQTTMNKGTIYKNRFGNNSVEFLSNHFTEQRILIKVNRDEDLIQKRTLFEGVNQIQPFCVDEKILIKIKQMSQYQIINSLTEYSKTYNELKKLYQQYYKILVRMNQRQQNQQNNYHNNLKDEKLRILTELQNRKIFVIGDFHNTQEMQDYIQREIPVQAGNNNQQNPQNERNRMIQNSLQKHFLKINFQPILFETNLNSKNIFLSRKQLYYSKYSHQLSPFFNKNEQKHRQILENLSVIKILQELATCFHIQYKKLELSYNQNPKDIIVWIEAFIQGINLTFGTGAHIYRSATYFSNIAEKALQVQKFSKGFSVATLWVNCVLAALSIGLDAYTYSKGYVCGRQIIFNSTFNLISGVLSIITFSATGLGLVFGAGAGLIAFIGYGISALLFTSSETYDQTLGLILKRIMDDQLPNQNLQYFQKSQFLKELNINNYYELQSKKAYELYRNIDKENYQQNEQNQYLLRLMNSNYPQRLQDQISYYITKNLISNLFLFETEYAQNQNIKDYLENITKQINYNQKIIDTFYNRFDQQNLLQKIKENKQRVDNNVKERTQHQNIDLQNDQIFKDSLLAYKESLNQFIQHIKQIEYSYQQYKEFGNGVVRKNDRFPITFNGYCNLVHEKSKQIFKQDTIRQINKNNNYFVINPENDFNNNFFQFTDSEWIFYLNLLISTDQFITNRYLLKYKGQNEFTFSYMSIEEMIDVDVKVQVEKFVDLYEIAKPLNGFDEFIANIKRQIDTELRFNEEMLMRLKKFYNSIGQLKETFR